MKYRPRIGDADFDTKTRKVRQFLDGGDRVKITVQLRGRERSRPSLASDMVHRVVDELDGEASLLHEPKGEGRSFSAVLEPAG